MTHETYLNLVRVQDKRIARARVTGSHSEISEACEEKEKLAEQWRREQMSEENERLKKEKSDAERRQLGLAYDVTYLRGEIQRAIDYANGRESEWGERAEEAFAILHAALSVPASQACEDTHRLNSGTILLGVGDSRVLYVAQDLRAAIDAGIAANSGSQTDAEESRR